MKLDLICSKNDEYYTPKYAVEPILEFLPKHSLVWCPFDTKKSEYVKVLSENEHEVIYSHISEGKDFFKYFPGEHIEYIISNPPYSLKNEVFERLFNISIPFAMLVGLTGIFESQKRFNMFSDNPFEVLYFNKRVEFYSDNMRCSPPFSSGYICSQFLPQRNVFRKINKVKLREESL